METDSPHVEAWFDSLTDQQRIWLAAKVAGADSGILYAIGKPWKYRAEAWRLHCQMAVERGERWNPTEKRWIWKEHLEGH
jgi:hypothetical protein